MVHLPSDVRMESQILAQINSYIFTLLSRSYGWISTSECSGNVPSTEEDCVSSLFLSSITSFRIDMVVLQVWLKRKLPLLQCHKYCGHKYRCVLARTVTHPSAYSALCYCHQLHRRVDSFTVGQMKSYSTMPDSKTISSFAWSPLDAFC